MNPDIAFFDIAPRLRDVMAAGGNVQWNTVRDYYAVLLKIDYWDPTNLDFHSSIAHNSSIAHIGARQHK